MSASAFGPLVDAHLKAERRRAKDALFAYVYGRDQGAAQWAGAVINRAGEVGLSRALAEAGPRPAPETSPSRNMQAAGAYMAASFAEAVAEYTLAGSELHKAIEAHAAAAEFRVPITWELAQAMADPTRAA